MNKNMMSFESTAHFCFFLGQKNVEKNDIPENIGDIGGIFGQFSCKTPENIADIGQMCEKLSFAKPRIFANLPTSRKCGKVSWAYVISWSFSRQILKSRNSNSAENSSTFRRHWRYLSFDVSRNHKNIADAGDISPKKSPHFILKIIFRKNQHIGGQKKKCTVDSKDIITAVYPQTLDPQIPLI